ncbi:MAG TPA: hypothetical protein VGE08_18355 [Steroidobacter sp.]|uniref:hypothetical protein n=1 Tax=Steroidobacter sp. TaxID=1978227 RepID=UPI002ED92625
MRVINRRNAGETTPPSNARAVDVRQVLQRVNEGLAYEQIAARLALSPRVVLGELSRAYSQLCIRMKREDIK